MTSVEKLWNNTEGFRFFLAKRLDLSINIIFYNYKDVYEKFLKDQNEEQMKEVEILWLEKPDDKKEKYIDKCCDYVWESKIYIDRFVVGSACDFVNSSFKELSDTFKNYTKILEQYDNSEVYILPYSEGCDDGCIWFTVFTFDDELAEKFGFDEMDDDDKQCLLESVFS